MKKYQRESTMMRNKQVIFLYEKVLDELGELKNVVSKSYIYDKIKEETGLSHRTISEIINHRYNKDIYL